MNQTFEINNVEYSLGDLQKRFNIPTENVDVVGKNLISTNADEFLRKEKFIETWRCFPIDGVAYKTYSKIYDNIFEKNRDLTPLQFLDVDIVSVKSLSRFLGPSQSLTIISGLNNQPETISWYDVLRMLVIPGCGRSIRKQFSRKLSGLSYDFKGLTKDIIEQLENSTKELKRFETELDEYAGIKVINVEDDTQTITEDTVTYVMTGSPKKCGFGGTKAEFQKALPQNWVESKKLDSSTTYLITGDIESNSSKSKKAKELGITIITYSLALENL